MATCRQCGHGLDDDHRCRGVAWLRIRVSSIVLGGAVLAAASAWGALAWMDERVSPLAIVGRGPGRLDHTRVPPRSPRVNRPAPVR